MRGNLESHKPTEYSTLSTSSTSNLIYYKLSIQFTSCHLSISFILPLISYLVLVCPCLSFVCRTSTRTLTHTQSTFTYLSYFTYCLEPFFLIRPKNDIDHKQSIHSIYPIPHHTTPYHTTHLFKGKHATKLNIALCQLSYLMS